MKLSLKAFLIAFLFLSFPNTGTAEEAPIHLFPLTPRGDAITYIDANPRLYIDDNGIPMYQYPHGDEPSALFLTTYALSLFSDVLTHGREVDEQNLLKQIDWITAHLTLREKNGVEFLTYESKYRNIYYDTDENWTNALTNGRMLALFSQLYRYYGDDSYLDTSHKLFKSFLLTMEDGGTASFGDEYWLEEVSYYNIPSYRILNGHIGAVMGLWTYYKNIPSLMAKKYLDKSIATVKNTIEQFDAGFVSYYDRNLETEINKLAQVKSYNHQHIRQLEWLNCVEPEQEFIQYALQFNKYETPRISVYEGEEDVTENVISKLYGRSLSFSGQKSLLIELLEPTVVKELFVASYPDDRADKFSGIRANLTTSSGEIISKQVDSEQIQRENKIDIGGETITSISLELDSANDGKSQLGSIYVSSDDYPSSTSNWWARNSANNSNKIFYEGYVVSRYGHLTIELGRLAEASQFTFDYQLANPEALEPKFYLKCAESIPGLAEVNSQKLEQITLSSTHYQFPFTLEAEHNYCHVEFSDLTRKGVLKIETNITN